MILRAWQRTLRPLGVGAVLLLILWRSADIQGGNRAEMFTESVLLLFPPIALLIGFEFLIRRICVEKRRMDFRSHVMSLLYAAGVSSVASFLTLAISGS